MDYWGGQRVCWPPLQNYWGGGGGGGGGGWPPLFLRLCTEVAMNALIMYFHMGERRNILSKVCHIKNSQNRRQPGSIPVEDLNCLQIQFLSFMALSG